MNASKLFVHWGAAWIAVFVCLSSVAQAQTTTKAYKYSAAITVAFPTGSAGASATVAPKGIRYSPCDSAVVTPLNLAKFTFTFDAGKPAEGTTTAESRRNVYFMFFRPEAKGTDTDPKLYIVNKSALGVALNFRAKAADMDPATDAYLPASYNPGGATTDTIFGGSISLEGLASGLWIAVGIIANSETPTHTKALPFLDDPSQWAAWDAVPLIVRKPWQGKAGLTCD